MRFLNRITARTLLAGLATAALGGCASDGYQRDDYYDAYGYDDGPAYYSERSGYYYNSPGYGYGYGGGYPYHGGHGGHYHRHGEHRDYQRQARVPRDADLVANGEQGLAYQAPQSGRVYVRDEKTGKVIYRGRVDAGEEVKVAADAKGRRVSVDGKTARGDLSARPREREVFFRPDRGTVNRSDVRSGRAAQQAAARVEARETRAAKSEARSEAKAAARSESRSESRSGGDGGSKGSGKKGD